MVPLITSRSTASASLKNQADAPVSITFTPHCGISSPNTSSSFFFQKLKKKLQVWGSRPKHYLHQPLAVQRNLLQPHKDNHPGWETSNMRNALTDKGNLGRGWKKAAFNHRPQHAELLSKHPRRYQKTQAMPAGTVTHCTWEMRTARDRSSSGGELDAAIAPGSSRQLRCPASGPGHSSGLSWEALSKRLWICTLCPPELTKTCLFTHNIRKNLTSGSMLWLRGHLYLSERQDSGAELDLCCAPSTQRLKAVGVFS